MAIRLQVRRDTSTNWSTNNPILQVGEFGFDITVNRFKVGIASNETSRWNVLPYLNVIPSELKELAQDFVEEAITAGTGITKSYNDSANTLTIAVDNTIANKTYVDTAVSGLSSTSATTYIPLSLLGNADGVAELDADGYVPASQLTNTLNDITDYVDGAVAGIINAAPDALNTLNELAAAINDDASYAATITTSLGLKAPLASPTFTGTVAGISKAMVGLPNVDDTSDANKPVSTATQTALDLKLSLSEPSVDYYVSNAGMGSYMVNGISNGTIYFEKGKKYRIHVNATGHPFWIQTVPLAYSYSNVYNTGITNNGTQNGHIIVELAADAPQLYYACEFHSSMNGSIVTGTTSQTYKSLSNLSNVDNTSDATKALLSYIAVSDATRTINSATDKNKLIEFSNACTVTIPNDTQDTGWPVGSMVELRQSGTGQITVTKDAAVTMVGPDSQFKSRVQWSTIMLEKRSANSWLVTGDTTA